MYCKRVRFLVSFIRGTALPLRQCCRQAKSWNSSNMIAHLIRTIRTSKKTVNNFENIKSDIKLLLAKATTFLENSKVVNIIFNYIFGLTFESPFSN